MKNLRKLFFCTSLCMAFAFGLFIADANSQASIPPATEIGDGDFSGGGRAKCHHNTAYQEGGKTSFCNGAVCVGESDSVGNNFKKCGS